MFLSKLAADLRFFTEILVLRDRLERETVRRQLVEESCENERRRRKHAEGMLDDARREYSTPLVMPAMMDAFQKIAQLTGDALMANDEDVIMATEDKDGNASKRQQR